MPHGFNIDFIEKWESTKMFDKVCSTKYTWQKCSINYFRQIVESFIYTLVSNSTKMFDKTVVEQIDIFLFDNLSMFFDPM